MKEFFKITSLQNYSSSNVTAAFLASIFLSLRFSFKSAAPGALDVVSSNTIFNQKFRKTPRSRPCSSPAKICDPHLSSGFLPVGCQLPSPIKSKFASKPSTPCHLRDLAHRYSQPPARTNHLLGLWPAAISTRIYSARQLSPLVQRLLLWLSKVLRCDISIFTPTTDSRACRRCGKRHARMTNPRVQE